MRTRPEIYLSNIWIGPPPDAKTGMGVPGHDVLYPMQMAEHIRQDERMQLHRIIFWCLEQYVPHYVSAFKNHSIQVNSIERFLGLYLRGSTADNFTVSSAIALKIMMDELLRPERNTVRDRVTIKNAFSLFVLLSVGDYVLDTNIRPIDGQRLFLPAYNEFHAPAMYENPFEKYTLPHAARDIDVWMLYSPPQNNQRAMSVFDHFCHLWNAAQEVYENESNSESYYKKMARAIVKAVFEAPVGEIRYWRAIAFDEHYIARIVALGIEKFYFNTHKHYMRSEYEKNESLLKDKFTDYVSSTSLGLFTTQVKHIIFDYAYHDKEKLAMHSLLKPPTKGLIDTEIFYVTRGGHLNRLKELISLGADINQQSAHPATAGETPLHAALHLNKFECAELLLKQGARTDLKVKYKEEKEPLTAVDLIKKIQPLALQKKYENLLSYSPVEKNKPIKKSSS